jgi:chaperonin cofactor prefoldin
MSKKTYQELEEEIRFLKNKIELLESQNDRFRTNAYNRLDGTNPI